MHSDDATPTMGEVEALMLELVLLDTGETGSAAAYHLSAGGSRVRAELALYAGRALALPSRGAVAIAAACELLHNASLVHDDLQDRDINRRGKPAVWRRYGDAAAICVGDLLLSAAYGALAGTGAVAAQAMTRMHRRVAAVIRGQSDDLTLQGSTLDSLETYERVAAGKSAPLLILPIELSLLLAGREDAIDAAVAAGSLFAIGYQMDDDLQDLERDGLNEELNVVAVLAAAGEPLPRQRARALAMQRFRQAHAAAALLPSGCGERLGVHALGRAEKLSGVAEMA